MRVASPKNPCAVLIHGHHLQAPDWEVFVWGTKELEQVGRIPRGVEIALKEEASLIIWGTGASIDPETGKKESEYTRDFALDHAAQLATYIGVQESVIHDLIQHKSLVQTETTNTKNETYEALRVCKERGIRTLFLVSSPTHIPRCLLTACQFQKEFPDIVLVGVAAESATEYWNPKDTVVVEPSHRPDRSEVPMNKLAKRMASARKHTQYAPELYENIEKQLDDFDKKVKN